MIKTKWRKPVEELVRECEGCQVSFFDDTCPICKTDYAEQDKIDSEVDSYIEYQAIYGTE